MLIRISSVPPCFVLCWYLQSEHICQLPSNNPRNWHIDAFVCLQPSSTARLKLQQSTELLCVLEDLVTFNALLNHMLPWSRVTAYLCTVLGRLQKSE